jgi:hypothetical protein
LILKESLLRQHLAEPKIVLREKDRQVQCQLVRQSDGLVQKLQFANGFAKIPDLQPAQGVNIDVEAHLVQVRLNLLYSAGLQLLQADGFASDNHGLTGFLNPHGLSKVRALFAIMDGGKSGPDHPEQREAWYFDPTDSVIGQAPQEIERYELSCSLIGG